MKRKLLSMLLAIAMLVSMIPTYAVATSTPEIYVDTSAIGDLKEGDSVSIPISIKDNPGICFAYLEVDIPDVLTYVSIEEKTGADNIVWTAPNKVQWEYDTDYTEEYSEDGVLFVLNFTVNAEAEAGTYDFGVGLLNGLASNLGDAEDDVTANFAAGQITIVYETAGLSFVNGPDTMDYAAAKAEALGTGSLTKPDSTNTYYFAGWFSGLPEDYADGNGFYVIDAAATGITGTEFRPRYDNPSDVTGTYNALWIKDDGTGNYVMAVGADTFGIYYNTTAATALTDAIAAAAGTGRTKLLHDLSLTAQLQPTVSFSLDMNGCTVSSTARVFYFTTAYADGTSGTCTSATVDSGRAGGAITTNNTLVIGCADTAVSISDVKLESSGTSSGALTLYAATLKNCVINTPKTTYFAVKVNSGYTATFDGCGIHTDKGKTMQCLGTATVTNCTITAGSTAAPFNGKYLEGNGNITFGAGNTVTAASAAALADYFTGVTFTAAGTYQIASTGSVCTNTTTVTCPVAGETAGLDSDGYVIFGTPCNVHYYEGSSWKVTKTAMKGGYADLTYTYTIGDGNQYELVGWTTDSAAETPMEQVLIEGETTLYAVTARKGVIIGGTEFESGDASKSMGADGSALTVYNADRLNELDSLTISAADSSLTKLVFSKDALADIADQITGDSKNMSVAFYWSNSDVSDGAASGVEIALTYCDNAIEIPEGVQVQLATGTNTGSVGSNRKYVVYNTADSENLINSETVESYHYCVYFTLSANGTYETKLQEGTYLTDRQTTGSKSVSIPSGETELIVDNAAKLADMTSLEIESNDDIVLTFSATALDSIAAQAGSDSVTISLESSETTLEKSVARADLSVLDSNGNSVSFNGSVKVKIPFTPEEGKNYRVYYVPETGDPVALGTSFDERNETTKYAVFTTTHFSGYEVLETEVADGYTAGLTASPASVRAGGNTVEVTVAVSHSEDTVYNAGEFTLTYDSTLLTFDQAGSNLPANAQLKDENGTLTVEFYGAEIKLPHDIVLAFKTVSSVNADTTTVVELTGAAFADSEIARSLNLDTATLAPATATVTVQLESYTVTLPTDKDATGSTEAVKNSTYTFTVNKDEHYTYTVTATMSSTPVDVTDNGNGTYSIENVSGPIEVTIDKTAIGYSVTFKGESPAKNDGEMAYHDTPYTFTLPTLNQYVYTYTVTIGGEPYGRASCTNNVVTIPGEDITGEIVVTISKTQTEFNVSFTGEDAVWADADGGALEAGDTITVTVTPADGYTYSVAATQTNGAAVTVSDAVTNDNGTVTYSISGFTSDITITVSKSLIGTAAVTQYIQVNGLSIMLVTYNATLADTSVPYYTETKTETVDGTETATEVKTPMYWSEEYGAYCYLVIAETLTEEDATAAISIASGSKTDQTISYSCNVNGSTATDAADAQLVYDMYNAMYDSFDTVSMLKFLLADVNYSKNVNTEDAAAIISEVLNPTAAVE